MCNLGAGLIGPPLFMTHTEIRAIANEGTDAEVADLYRLKFGKDISHCVPCLKYDARFYLNRLATAMANNTTLCAWRIKSEWAETTHINDVQLRPLTEEKVVQIEAFGFGHILEPIADPKLGEPITPAALASTEPEVKPEPTNGKAKK